MLLTTVGCSDFWDESDPFKIWTPGELLYEQPIHAEIRQIAAVMRMLAVFVGDGAGIFFV